MASPLAAGIVPAQLGFLAIYNPVLGTTDETIEDQIVYYASASTQTNPGRRRHRSAKDVSREERNERLRQIGLAQAMVEFGKSFSGGRPVDSIDTERSRVVLHELEPGWWILASVDLTRLPPPPGKTTTSSSPAKAPSQAPARGPSSSSSSVDPSQSPPDATQLFEYSSREVKPAALLLQDLLRAHALFLLHHAGSLSELLARSQQQQRARFVALLARYWDLFLSTWNVLLHGNPACSVFGGIKIAACGELGIGVGEEDRGSGEREVLEGLAASVDGLVDLVVGRYGELPRRGGGGGGGGGRDRVGKGRENAEAWFGVGGEVGAEDGAVFLGVGALSRQSLRAVTFWMEEIYTWGENAYGVFDPLTELRPKRRKQASRPARISSAAGDKRERVEGQSRTPEPPSTGDANAGDPNGSRGGPATAEEPLTDSGGGGTGMDRIFSYLKLGYGTSWSLGSSSPASQSDTEKEATAKPPAAPHGADSQQSSLPNPNRGRFLIPLSEQTDEQGQAESPGHDDTAKPRTVTVQVEAGADHSPQSSQTRPKTEDFRPVVYVHRPFIYILLFRPAATLPAWPDLSQALQTHLSALHKPLLTSTAYRPERPDPGIIIPPTAAHAPPQIYDLVFDRASLTIHSTIPNIPEPASAPVPPPATATAASVLLPPPPITAASSSSAPSSSSPSPSPPPPPIWTRIEALNTHSQILAIYAATRGGGSAEGSGSGSSGAQELERTCKTSRGWWVVWNRVRDSHSQAQQQAEEREQWGLRADSASASASAGEGEEAAAAGRGGGEEKEQETEEEEEEEHCGGVGDEKGSVRGKEIFLVRRASDHGGSGGARGASASYVVAGTGGWADGASRLAQGIGVDTRRYIEGLLSLNR